MFMPVSKKVFSVTLSLITTIKHEIDNQKGRTNRKPEKETFFKWISPITHPITFVLPTIWKPTPVGGTSKGSPWIFKALAIPEDPRTICIPINILKSLVKAEGGQSQPKADATRYVMR